MARLMTNAVSKRATLVHTFQAKIKQFEFRQGSMTGANKTKQNRKKQIMRTKLPTKTCTKSMKGVF